MKSNNLLTAGLLRVHGVVMIALLMPRLSGVFSPFHSMALIVMYGLDIPMQLYPYRNPALLVGTPIGCSLICVSVCGKGTLYSVGL